MQQDFIEVQGESATNLFKIAANEEIGKLEGNTVEAKSLSLKY